jgi:peptidylprolyl isomerase
MRLLILLTAAALLALGIVACGDDDDEDGTPSNGNGDPAPSLTVTSSGLQIIDEVIGDGAEAVSGSTVTVHYVGTLDDGTQFDSSVDRGQPFPFTLGTVPPQVIQGWEEGIPGMRVGGKRRLIIPPELAYGDQQNGQIPPNSTLTFDVELLDVQ